MDRDEMRAWQQYEETGERPDDVLVVSAEDMADMDPDQVEILKEVADRYAQDNVRRRANRLEIEAKVLRAALEQAGIDPDEVLHG